MLGLMQNWPLLCHRVIDHAANNHAERQIVSRSIEGPIHATTYAALRGRALKVAQRLDRDGIGLGDRVATLAWNTWRHLEGGRAARLNYRFALMRSRSAEAWRAAIAS
jgi:fatty-acyl-CoA synthase